MQDCWCRLKWIFYPFKSKSVTFLIWKNFIIKNLMQLFRNKGWSESGSSKDNSPERCDMVINNPREQLPPLNYAVAEE